jgi:hypothetical protein
MFTGHPHAIPVRSKLRFGLRRFGFLCKCSCFGSGSGGETSDAGIINKGFSQKDSGYPLVN